MATVVASANSSSADYFDLTGRNFGNGICKGHYFSDLQLG
jgi:hypothetical protein